MDASYSCPAPAPEPSPRSAAARSAPGVMQLMKQAGVVARPRRTGEQPALRWLGSRAGWRSANRKRRRRAPGKAHEYRVHEVGARQARVGAHLGACGEAAQRIRSARALFGSARTETRSLAAGRPVLAASQPTKALAMKPALRASARPARQRCPFLRRLTRAQRGRERRQRAPLRAQRHVLSSHARQRHAAHVRPVLQPLVRLEHSCRNRGGEHARHAGGGDETQSALRQCACARRRRSTAAGSVAATVARRTAYCGLQRKHDCRVRDLQRTRRRLGERAEGCGAGCSYQISNPVFTARFLRLLVMRLSALAVLCIAQRC